MGRTGAKGKRDRYTWRWTDIVQDAFMDTKDAFKTR